jgi:hypothetical protein
MLAGTIRIASGTAAVGDCTGGGVEVEVGTGVGVPATTVPDPQADNKAAIKRMKRKNFARTSLLQRKGYPDYTLRRFLFNANIPPIDGMFVLNAFQFIWPRS